MTHVKLTKEKSEHLSQKSSNQDLLRSGIIAELDAINLYQSHIENIDDDESKKVLAHIRDEEKEHVAELACVLSKQDPDQGMYFKKFLKSLDIKELDCTKHNHKE